MNEQAVWAQLQGFQNAFMAQNGRYAAVPQSHTPDDIPAIGQQKSANNMNAYYPNEDGTTTLSHAGFLQADIVDFSVTTFRYCGGVDPDHHGWGMVLKRYTDGISGDLETRIIDSDGGDTGWVMLRANAI